ncbi:MAG TPA: UdgX family uracil-DNA binding protein [Clostridia bacterium]|nr:UdgX family uracil-DNA binding protein [Clostridia bacterium]
MRTVVVEPTLASWQTVARSLLAAKVAPEEVVWIEQGSPQASLFAADPVTDSRAGSATRVPRKFLDIAADAACHRSGNTWALLYRVLWRIVHDNRNLLSIGVDPDVRQLLDMQHQVRQDIHRMHAFVRFRHLEAEDRYVAWYRPDHRIERRAAEFFARRFASMRWSILTPGECAHWDGRELTFTSGLSRAHAPAEDEMESLWREYYRSTFNPARVNVELMRQEMPARYWSAMPEAEVIQAAVAESGARVNQMIGTQREAPSARPWVPPTTTLPVLREAIHACEGCPIHAGATQPVFGEGPADARIMLVGEQPGDAEDLAGKPFVGPAGEVLRRALVEAGADAAAVYVTNAVKHFKYVERGKRRIHQTPRLSEVVACRPWLEAEIAAVRPELIVCLGATAAKSLLGATFQLTRQRGQVIETRWAPKLIATFHPSAVLRASDDRAQQQIYRTLVEDLRAAAAVLASAPARTATPR